MAKYIIKCDESANQICAEIVGGKASSLFELKKLPLNIPDYFVIFTSAFGDFLRMNKIDQDVEILFQEKNYDEIRKLILQNKIPDIIMKEIEAAYISLKMEMVSVRSSAVLEDGKWKSFAGQFDSILSVAFQNLEINIKRCWASYFNNNVMEYVEQSPMLCGMAVIVQKMVNADISGIGFSKSPVAVSEDCVLIEAAPGVGENIVSGIITPNQYFYSIERGCLLNTDANNLLSLDNIAVLAECICRIRDWYQIEVDTEWCIKDGIVYFLQARPITAVSNVSKPYKKTLVRPLPLLRVELYAVGEYEGIKWLTDGQFYFNPLFLCENRKIAVYYNNISQKENPINMYRYLCNHYDEFLLKYKQLLVACNYIEKVISGEETFSLNEFVASIIKIYPFSSLGNLAGNLPVLLVGEVYGIFKEFREQRGELLTKAEEFLMQKAENIVESEYLFYYRIQEIFSGKPISLQELQKRKQGYVYFNKMLLVEKQENQINNYLNENNIALINEEETSMNDTDELKGMTAYGGRIKGIVSIIENENDFYKMEGGNILVASMTVPKFLPAMKKAMAMVTDEGGVLCHASIVARELKIPTVIGTKRATTILQDGDFVEVDASNAKVIVLKRKIKD